MTAGPRIDLRLGVVLLAAGLGRRMGGPNKLLVDLGGAPLVRHVGEPLAEALPDAPRVAVTGRDSEAVAAALAGQGWELVHNPRYIEGMGRSLATGVAMLPADLDGVLVMLGDQPGLTPGTVVRLCEAFVAAPDPTAAIIRPVYKDKEGHPVLWGRAWRPALLGLEGDQGGRDLIRLHAFDHAGRVVRVPVDDPAVTRDVDHPEELAALRASWERTVGEGQS
ncbi:nucleotidyltransferase family protein [Roseospira visakhapatnamensis]|uniref:Molybdenum cofactor cytidylyltransferase n=1 Tax=Roseospira visakhapatnamensis TaxID=390880 RepID=A0A7W6RAK6_9PROT|nr:nucleotidyltransferase family protein [Roseospira visakhapatnamensis]MBB4264969.1 molybdenum cofactor cytidylyltransferase [Roseospira visakhapatnamensis]